MTGDELLHAFSDDGVHLIEGVTGQATVNRLRIRAGGYGFERGDAYQALVLLED